MKAFNKDILRSITKSWGRFIAILLIVALGVGFYAGLRMTAPDMRLAADQYYDGTSLYDIRLLSTTGFSDDSVTGVRSIEGVAEVMASYETDVIGISDGNQYALRMHSLDIDAAIASDSTDGITVLSDDAGYLNRPVLISGEWPTAEGECVLSATAKTAEQFALGDTIELSEGLSPLDEVLNTQSYTVVGFVRSSYYSASASLGSTTIGGGIIDQYMYVPASTFKDDYPYSALYLLVEGARELDATSSAYDDAVDKVLSQLEAYEPTLASARLEELTTTAQEQLDEKRAEFTDEQTNTLAELDAAVAELDAAAAELATTEAELNAASAELTAQAEQLSSAQAILGSASPEIMEGTAAYSQALATYNQGLEAYNQGVSSYEQNLAEYEAARTEAEEGFAAAETELNEAQQEIDDAVAPDIFIMDRSKNIGAQSYDSDAGRVDQIAQVFPLLFFLVAALISLTTMTRMVEEERTLIGTYKALGYSRQRIASKYPIYALIASVIGAIIGLATLTQVLPRVIMNAYTVMYDIPEGPTPVDPGIAALSCILGIGATCFAAWAAANTTLREKPAALMLPKTPKAGKRIFLERIGFIWKHLSFSWKVTCRNIFRYKKRLAMTLIGVAGCTSLLLTGFGLNDAIDDIIPKQFGQIYHYNLTVALHDDITANEEAAVEEILSNADLVTASGRAHTEQVTAHASDNSDMVVLLIAPEDPQTFPQLRAIRERVSQQDIAIDKDHIIVSEKLASELGLGVGDTITLFRQDMAGFPTEDEYDFVVGGVMEDYVGHCVILDPELLEKVTGEAPSFATIFANATNDSNKRNEITEALLPLDGIKTVGFNDDMIDTYEKGLASVDTIVVVLIIAAAALAFVVLYNLTNINITERRREIATLKVLGFSKPEMAVYVFREMILLTLLGAALGLVMGIFMEGYVVTTAEVDAVMFGREIHALSFIIAFVLTVFFSFLIAFFMRGKLTHINMVESLKSNE